MCDPAFAVLIPYLQEYLFFHFHSAYDHQTWLGGDLP